MATIRTAIQINDMMSQQFRAMNMAMTTVIDSFHTLQDATGSAIDVSALNAAQRELQQVEATFNQVEQEIRQAEQAQENLNKDIQKSENLADGLLSKIGAIAGAYLTIQAIGNAINLSDELTNITARLDMMNDGLQTTAELQQMIYESAQRSYGAYSQTADLVGKLGLNAPEAFGSVAETVAFAELLNKQFAIAGTSQEGVSAATQQLIQALGSGVLRGEELNSIFEQSPNIIRTIADYLGVGVGEIRGMAAEGEITAELVKASMFSAADDINEKFNSMPLTFSQLWISFQNEALMAFQPVLQKMNDIANSDRFAGFIDRTVSALSVIANAALIAFEIIGTVGSFIYDNWAMLGPLIMGVGTILTAFVSYLFLVKTATVLVTTATWLWTQALNANPIVRVLIVIIALISLFYAAVGAINQFAGTTISATGIIVGALSAAGAIIANIFIYIWNVAVEVFVTIYNIAATVAEGLANVFVDPIGAIVRMFAQMADNVLGILESIAKGIDFVFGSNLASSVSGWRSDLDSLVDEVYGENAIEIKRMASADFQLKPFDVVDAWDAGYNLGANLETSFQGPNIDDIMTNSMAGVEGLLGANNALNKDVAKNTGKMADSIELSTEDIAYLRDIAERESINRYTTAEIKVDMKNENYINSEMDIDGVIDRFGERVEEVAETLAEGDDEDV